VETKHCKHCDRELLLSNFHKDRNKKGGLAYYCKECVSKQGKKYRNTADGIYSSIIGRYNFGKHTGKREYKPVKITREEFVKWYNAEPKFCHYCSIPEQKLKTWNKTGRGRNNRLSIDCKDNFIGYIQGNLALACDKCNLIKSSIITYNEMLFIGQNFVKPKWQHLLNHDNLNP